MFQCSTQEFYLISSGLSRLGLELQALLPAIQSQISSALLRGLLLDTPDLLAPAHSHLKVLNEKAAKWVSSSMKQKYLLVKEEGKSTLHEQQYKQSIEIIQKTNGLKQNIFIYKWCIVRADYLLLLNKVVWKS